MAFCVFLGKTGTEMFEIINKCIQRGLLPRSNSGASSLPPGICRITPRD
jgi:hypothetical protein